MSTGKLVLGMLTGIAAGVALGLLISSDKGSAIRKSIAEKGDDYADELKDGFNNLVENLSGKFDAVKRETSHLADKGMSKVRSM